MKNLNINPKLYYDLKRYPDFEEISSKEVKTSLIDTMNSCSNTYHKLKYEDYYNNIFLIMLYEEILKKISKYIDPNTNMVSLLTLIREMIYSGVFSYGNFYKYSTEPYKELDYFQGLNVLYGKGCCRNECSFVYDLFKEIGIKALPIDGAVSPVFKSFNDTETLLHADKVRSIEVLKDTLLGIRYYFKSISNHAIIVTPYKDSALGFDITNSCAYSIKGYNASVINGIGSMKLVPSTLVSDIGYNFNDVMDVCDFLLGAEPIDKKEVLKRYNEGLELYKNSKVLIKEIRSSIEEDLKEIDRLKEKVTTYDNGN